MPVDHARKFIFIHVPKSGGMSVMEALRSGGCQMEYDGFGVPDTCDANPNGRDLHARYAEVFRSAPATEYPQQHIPSELLRDLVPDTVWIGYFKFGFTRSPWDRLVSVYHYLKSFPESPDPRVAKSKDHETVLRYPDFDSYVRSLARESYQPIDFFFDRTGAQLVDFIGRYERIESDFAFACRAIGIDVVLPHVNSSSHREYREYYSAETKAIVARRYEREIDRYGYSF